MAITTAVDIGNLALGRVGISTRISTFTENTKEARAVRDNYDLVLNRLLRAFPWQFSTETEVLIEDTSLRDSDLEFYYAYTLPSGHLRTWSIGDTTQKNKWAHRTVRGTKMIFCNYPPASTSGTPTAPVSRYTTSDVEIEEMSPEFIDALAWHLAAEIALPLRADVKMAQLLPLRAKFALEQAVAADANEQEPADEPDGFYIKARG